MQPPHDASSDPIASLRSQIRELDRQIIELAGRRVALARHVGDVKRTARQPIVDYGQERVVLERARETAEAAGLDARVAETLVGTLIRAAVSAQDQDSWRTASVGAGQTAVVIGGEGRMGRWFMRFLADQSYATLALDVRAPAAENRRAEAAIRSADLVLCATPPGATADVYARWRDEPPRGVIVDIASIKTPLVEGIRGLQHAGARVASIHPLFGPSVVLLRECDVVICDTGDADAAASVAQLFAATTARVVRMPLEEHDRLMADVLTLAHATAIAFALALPDESVPLRSTTLGALQSLAANVVRESPDVYYEIQALNPHSAHAIARLSDAVARVRAAVSSFDPDAFSALMADGAARTR
jgi:chorismate mutase/prephenate dehydrogenase